MSRFSAGAITLEGLEQLRSAAEVRLRETLQQFAVEGQTSVIPGHAVNAIVSYAESVGAALVVVGTHGHSGFARLALGSTASGVIDSAPCSVLVVRVAGK